MKGDCIYHIYTNFELLAIMERINGGMISVKLVEKSFYKYKNRLSNLPQDFNPTFLKHFNKDSYRFVWHKRKKKSRWHKNIFEIN